MLQSSNTNKADNKIYINYYLNKRRKELRDYMKEAIDNYYDSQPLKGTRPNEFDYLVDKDVKKMEEEYDSISKSKSNS